MVLAMIRSTHEQVLREVICRIQTEYFFAMFADSAANSAAKKKKRKIIITLEPVNRDTGTHT